MNSTEVKIVEPNNVDLLQLVNQLDQELLQLYPVEDVHGIDFDDAKINEVVFVVAYVQGLPVGCGAIRPLDREYTELKRFYVEPGYRKQGIAARMLEVLELKARDRNFAGIRLETGAAQPESLAFYQKHGYVTIEKYGEYVNYELSLCYEKRFATRRVHESINDKRI
jgi:GNAT superfamily N-acetyltransferase